MIKRSKRGNSEGSIIKRPDGRYEARVTLPDRKRRSFYGKTRQEANQKLLQVQNAISDSLPLAGARQNTGAFLEAWLRDSAAPRVRPKTLMRYQELVRPHIAPEIVRVRLARVTPARGEYVVYRHREGRIHPYPRALPRCAHKRPSPRHPA